jgi:hypothetical protein
MCVEDRLFLALPINYDTTSAHKAELSLRWIFRQPEDFPPPDPLSITKSDVFYREEFPRFGSWDGWTYEIANGVNYNSRTPRFTAVVLVASQIGRGTKQIVEKCLQADKPVLLLAEDRLNRVVAVEEIDSENWQNGWRVVVRP